jgi:release factor glutamine methyltransferase
VYEPAEDSWLLSDAVCGDAASWMGPPHAALILELGSGSGAVCTSVLLHLQGLGAEAKGAQSASGGGGGGGGSAPTPPSALCLACDLSPHACRVTASTGAANGVGSRLEVVQCDLLDALRARLRGCVDLLLFNPPYVPTPAEEVPAPGAFALGGGEAARESALDTLPAAWAGGENGRQVIDRALPLLAELLRKPRAAATAAAAAEAAAGAGLGAGARAGPVDGGGVAYMLLLEDNDPADIEAQLRAEGLQCSIVATRQAPCESLMVMRVRWSCEGADKR